MEAIRNMEDEVDQEGKKRCFPNHKLPRSKMGEDDHYLSEGGCSPNIKRVDLNLMGDVM
jgi:hypothetical protein